MTSLHFRQGGLDDDTVRGLVARHLEGMHESTPAGHVWALDLSGLEAPGVTFWSGWLGDDLAVIGALKELDADNAEIKSMRVADHHLGTGAGRAMLRHIVDHARDAGFSALWLETGRSVEFMPALRLYRSDGFTESGPFGDYLESPYSTFMTRALR